MEKKYRSIDFYPGADIREEVIALRMVLRGKGTSLSKQLRPHILRLLEAYKADIQAMLKESAVVADTKKD